MAFLDRHGQPPKAIYRERIVEQTVHEMLGLVKGLVCDGVVNDAEVVAFRQWVQANPDVCCNWPGSVLAQRVVQILDDGVIEEEEREDLRQLMVDTVGEPDDLDTTANYATRLPLDEPPPTIFFDGRMFCLTGKFLYGPRKKVEREITDRGGECCKSVVSKTDYLLIGTLASDAWISSAFGTKIEDAVGRRGAGHKIAIIGEQTFVETLQLDA